MHPSPWQSPLDAQTVRRTYAEVGLSYLPRVLTLLDTDPFSPTYGCFDRSFWHYKTMDFPSGMYQEAVLALAIAYAERLDEGIVNPYYQQSRLRELVLAGIRYAARSSHKDGSCDDYYPGERALGAVVYALHACTEAYLLLQAQDPEPQPDLEQFFKLRGIWLLECDETGQLSNHQALAASALYNVYRITGEERFAKGASERIDRALDWQSPEGWFQEYEGCDPGYLTATINFLAQYQRHTQDVRLQAPLQRAVRFARYFLHPDGSFGGEYGSRNTGNFYPLGLELLGEAIPEAVEIADGYVRAMKAGTRMYWEDDRIYCHFVNSCLQAALQVCPVRSQPQPPQQQRLYFPLAQMWVFQEGELYGVAGLAKGGVCKLFQGHELALSDTGLTGKLSDGRVFVCNLIDPAAKVDVSSDQRQVTVQGRAQVKSFKYATPLKQILFRLGLLVLARSHAGSQRVRKLLQKILITRKDPLPIRYERTFHLREEGLYLRDHLTLEGEVTVTDLAVGSDQTSIYVATSNCYQQARLQGWLNLNACVPTLNRDRQLMLERRIPSDPED
ncbi:hypothetical protein [Leptolyngbya sp. FACHB-261]|uniref:hypothetical protein n=1 Tax=Leptolyngbya sp. FACHB-261 TaxID=2692806 RepID=UPI0016841E0C|nr:hypothetical protein [Leptolyngbya sp. FACHB-261]